jgi:hypothetical protein
MSVHAETLAKRTCFIPAQVTMVRTGCLVPCGEGKPCEKQDHTDDRWDNIRIFCMLFHRTIIAVKTAGVNLLRAGQRIFRLNRGRPRTSFAAGIAPVAY